MESNTIEKIMRKKNVSQDNQLQAFVLEIIEVKYQIDFNKIEKIMRKKNVNQDDHLQEFITKII